MEVKNLAWNENQRKRCNHPLLPKGIRELIIGKSGCGKTTLLINLLLRPDWLDYNKINIFGKSRFQTEYHILKNAFEEKLPKEVIIRLFENQNEITDLGISPKQITCESCYVRERHSNVDCFYLAQNYFKLPLQNTNLICLFPQDLKNLNHIFDDHVGSDMTKEEFRQLCKKA